jgi:hypothetical protein
MGVGPSEEGGHGYWLFPALDPDGTRLVLCEGGKCGRTSPDVLDVLWSVNPKDMYSTEVGQIHGGCDVVALPVIKVDKSCLGARARRVDEAVGRVILHCETGYWAGKLARR